MYLLDTDTVIYALKGDSSVAKNLRLHFNDSLNVSVISFLELYYGAYKSPQTTSNLAKLKTLEESLEIIPVGPEISQTYGRIKSSLEKKGKRLDDFDLVIASTALARNLTLVSNNIDHFRRIDGLKLENWVER
jgi:tRNA(fMet)-specific endonuclease VapC